MSDTSAAAAASGVSASAVSPAGAVQGGVSRRGGYTRIGQSDAAEVSPSAAATAAADARRRRKETIERINTKVHAALWVIAAILVLYYTRLPAEIFSGAGNKTVAWAVDLGFACVGIVIAIAFYCIVWIRMVQGIDLHWDVVAPGMIPAATVAGVGSLVFFLVGLWPLFGFLTPLVVGTCFMGFVMSLHFIPAL